MVFLFSFLFSIFDERCGRSTHANVCSGNHGDDDLVLDPLLIFGWGPIPAYGVTGAAIATISQAVATVAGFYILMKGKRGIKLTLKNFRFDGPLLKKMFCSAYHLLSNNP
jgi:hypothetical protein